MASDINEDKLTIKNMLFTKALPNYTIPIATDGYKIFSCTDCGDKFLLESSYNYHINRKSLQITYFCRHCSNSIVFLNRCMLLSHIRSHAFRTATINVSDLKLEPLPIQEMNWTATKNHNNDSVSVKPTKTNICFECDELIDSTGAIQKDRAKHYMRYTNKVYTCPICLFTVPNTCILTAHLRIHLNISPYFCPECGIHLSSKSIKYPYFHDCEGFRMIRATTRVQCKQTNCNKIFHPNEYREHIKSHIKTIYKSANGNGRICTNDQLNNFTFPLGREKDEAIHQCEICNGQPIDGKESVYAHLNKHYKNTIDQIVNQVFPCMICNVTFYVIPQLIKHHIDSHGACKEILSKFLNESNTKNISKGIYRVIKRCDSCLSSFIYRCQLENIRVLPNVCPYKCTKNENRKTSTDNQGKNEIVCGICKTNINEDWENVKTHFATFHKDHKCLDLNVRLTKPKATNVTTTQKIFNKSLKYKNVRNKKHIKNSKKIMNQRKSDKVKKNLTISHIKPQRSPGEKNWCKVCNIKYEDDENFQKHIITHIDPCMAYQCLECGQCFVVKPSFSTHLLLEHGITDVNEYIAKKKCYNELALSKHINNSTHEKIVAPVKENQCKICRDQFENTNDLEKHFRMHGMAFLMKTKNNCP